jgi:hypothetical protein
MKIENIVKDLTDALDLDVPTRMLGIPDQEYVIQISPRQLLSVVEKLWEYGVWHLSTITCLQDEHFTLLYHFWYFGNLTVHLDLIEGDLQVQSICGLIPGRNIMSVKSGRCMGLNSAGCRTPRRFYYRIVGRAVTQCAGMDRAISLRLKKKILMLWKEEYLE